MAKIVVAGYMVRHPVGGNVWAYLHYVLGLHRLGHEVVYVEESGWPNSCYNPRTGLHGDDPSAGLRFVHEAAQDNGLHTQLIYVERETGVVHGADREELRTHLEEADLLINLGRCWIPEFRLCPRRAFVDIDPFFTQVGSFQNEKLDEHNVHFSYGANIGGPTCTIPTRGFRWHSTVPPVVVDVWNGSRPGKQAVAPPDQRAFTTLANWTAYGGVTYQGEHYGQKDEEFWKLLHLPSRTSQRLELALSGADPSTQELLRLAGWTIRDGNAISADMGAYETYVRDSLGEFSAAKNGYVKTRSGWFSDRSVCYLAAGRPTILQDTGFSDWLPAEEGVLGFSTIEQAAGHLEEVSTDYSLHARAAQRRASEFFDHAIVLPRLLEAALG
jgi:hypothetical protein